MGIKVRFFSIATIFLLGLVLSIGCNHKIAGQNAQPVQTVKEQRPTASVPKEAINVQSLGARGDGTADDTTAIQQGVDQAAATGATVYIPDGIYRIDTLRSIHMRNNVTMELAAGAVLQAIPNSAPKYMVIAIGNVEHVKIIGGKIQGDRQEHFGTDGEWGIGVRITGSKDITITGLTVNDCWGDGFYIGSNSLQPYSEDIQLIDVRADNNRRQGITLISGRNINIIRPVLTNSHGIAPAAGLSIEPNRNIEFAENVVIADAVTANNTEGIVVGLGKLKGSANSVSIHIINHRDEGSLRGFLISSGGWVVPGTISIQRPQWLQSQQNGLRIRDHPYGSFFIEVSQPVITDANASGNSDPAIGSGIVLYPWVGGVKIVNPTIRDTRNEPQMVHGIYLWDKTGVRINEVSIIDPLAIEGTTGAKINIQSINSSDVIIEDGYGKL